MSETLVWYAAYGSNLAYDRFRCYTAGGRPPGAARVYPGCRDRREPLADSPLRLHWPLYFAGESRVWTGGCAFVDTTRRSPGRTLARAWLLTAEQLADVVAQENYREPRPVDLAALTRTGQLTLAEDRYEHLVSCGELDRLPVVTLTSPWSMSDAELSPPAAAYVRLLGCGLAESHGLEPCAVADYLLDCPGVAGTWDADRLRDVLTP